MEHQLDYWRERVEETGRYFVNIWGSHPDEDNDDCWDGVDFETETAAQFVFENPEEHFGSYGRKSTTHIQLIGEGVNIVREFKFDEFEPDTGDDTSDWEREHATQAGMGLGVGGYNDAMGY